jgi:hypothetical protein
LDNNGFVLLSERSEHTGKFFGQIDGTIMDSLVQDRIFRRISLMDYQGVCSDRDNPYNAASERINPIQPISWILKYFFTFLSTWSFFTYPVLSFPHNYQTYEETMDYDANYEEMEYENGADENFTPEIEKPMSPNSANNPPRPTPPAQPIPRVVPDPAHARPCDLRTDLYLLQPDRLNSSGQSNPLKVRGD